MQQQPRTRTAQGCWWHDATALRREGARMYITRGMWIPPGSETLGGWRVLCDQGHPDDAPQEAHKSIHKEERGPAEALDDEGGCDVRADGACSGPCRASAGTSGGPHAFVHRDWGIHVKPPQVLLQGAAACPPAVCRCWLALQCPAQPLQQHPPAQQPAVWHCNRLSGVDSSASWAVTSLPQPHLHRPGCWPASAAAVPPSCW